MSAKCTEAALKANTRAFMGLGGAMGSPVGSVVTFVLGVILVAVLSAGINDVVFVDDLDSLWIEEGSRAEDDKKFYDDTFGGLDRIDQIVLTYDDLKEDPANDNDRGVLTRETIYALGNISKPVFADLNELTLEKTYGDDDVTFQYIDICNRAPIPPSMKPWVSADPTNYDSAQSIGSWLQQGTSDSGQWYYYSQCMGAKARATWVAGTPSFLDVFQLAIYYGMTVTEVQTEFGLLAGTGNPASVFAIADAKPGLDAGFGVVKAPCTRSSAMDCFREGIYDYPADLQQLNDYGLAFAALPDTTGALVFGAIQNGQVNATSDDLWWNQCRTDLHATLTGSLGLTELQVAQSSGLFDAVGLAAAAGFGYWFRPEMSSLADSEIAEYIFSGATNSIQQTATTCVVSGTTDHLFALGLSPTKGPLTTCCSLWSGTDVSPNLYLGGLHPSDVTTYGDSDALFAAATRISYSTPHEKSDILRQRIVEEKGLDSSSFTLDDLDDLLFDFDGVLIDYFEPKFKRKDNSDFGSDEQYSVYFLDYLVDRSIADMLEDAADIETHLLVIGYVVLLLYACSNFVMFEFNSNGVVYSRGLLCFIGVASIGLSTLSSFGFMGWSELSLSPTNAMLVPFLSMGLGIDDLFVMLTCYMRHHRSQDDPSKRIVETVGDAGSSITVTSAANMVAFLVASIIPLRAVYTFSLQMATAVILNWLCLLLLFTPFLYWDAVRVSKKKSIFCVSAQESETDAIGEEKLNFEKIVKEHIAPLYANMVFKIVALVTFIALTVSLAVVGFENVETGLKLSDVALSGTAIRSWAIKQEDLFTLQPGNIVTRTIEFTQDGEEKDFKDFQQNLLTALNDLGENEYIDTVNTPYSRNFLPGLIEFYQSLSGDSTAETVPTVLFYSTLQSYLGGLGVTDSEDLICKEVSSGNLQSCTSVDGETVKIEATRGTIYLNNLDTNQDYIDSIPSIRKTLDDSDGNKLPGTNTEFDPKMIYAHGSVFLFWQQYVDIEDNLWMVVGFALLGVFGATFLFQFSPLTSLLVGVMLGATVLQLYGLMYAIGVKLNAFSLTNLAIAVGMAVEFTAHIAYAFLRAEAPSQDRDARVAYALSEMMQPMVSGAMTTFISVICLAFAKYPFFSLYYFEMISLMILMAFLNGMVFLPVILSLIGPSGMPDIGKMSVDYSQRSGAGKALEDSGL